MTLHRLLHRGGVDIGHIGQLILRNQPDAGDVEQRINFRRRFTGQLIEVIDVVGAGAAASITVVTPVAMPTLSGSS